VRGNQAADRRAPIGALTPCRIEVLDPEGSHTAARQPCPPAVADEVDRDDRIGYASSPAGCVEMPTHDPIKIHLPNRVIDHADERAAFFFLSNLEPVRSRRL
jgi:hypothetical protein